ncbi:MAG: YcaO-like family protein [bacterium]
MHIEDIDLNGRLEKTWAESERSVTPDVTIARALEATRSIGIELEVVPFVHGDVFWTARINTDFKAQLSANVRHFRVGGKGPSEKQATASCVMEFIERWSQYRFTEAARKQYECYDLREQRTYEISAMSDIYDTKCVAAGNNYEEAILHCLHELIETRMANSLWKPFRIVEPQTLYPDLPEWVHRNMLLVLTPNDVPEFYHITAVKYPSNGQFDTRVRDQIIKVEGQLFWSPANRPTNYHSPNSGSAAGLNPALCAFRAMNEVFQGDYRALDDGKKRPPPEFIQVATSEDLPSYETDSITDDIRIILDRLGEDVFVGVIDLTDPKLGIPVVKLVSDYDPVTALAARRTLAFFYDFC